MKIAYLFLVHKNPKLISEVIPRLSCADSGFFIHVDRKSDIQEFASTQGANVHFSDKRVPVCWGEFSQVEAILILIQQALASIRHYDYFVLLSGSEYPLRSGQYIPRFFEANRGLEYMTLAKMPAPGKPLSRINTLRFPSSRPVLRFIFRVLAKLGLAQRDYRKHLGNLEPYSGLTWWALSREACQYIVGFTKSDRVLAKFLENTFASDEAFFHTILGNSAFKSRMRRNLMYEDWSVGGAHPAMINEQHLALFEAQKEVCVHDLHGPGEMLFARKFSDDNLQLLPRIDEMIKQKGDY